MVAHCLPRGVLFPEAYLSLNHMPVLTDRLTGTYGGTPGPSLCARQHLHPLPSGSQSSVLEHNLYRAVCPGRAVGGWQVREGSPEEAGLRWGVEGRAFVRMSRKEDACQTPEVGRGAGPGVARTSGASELASGAVVVLCAVWESWGRRKCLVTEAGFCL